MFEDIPQLPSGSRCGVVFFIITGQGSTATTRKPKELGTADLDAYLPWTINGIIREEGRQDQHHVEETWDGLVAWHSMDGNTESELVRR